MANARRSRKTWDERYQTNGNLIKIGRHLLSKRSACKESDKRLNVGRMFIRFARSIRALSPPLLPFFGQRSSIKLVVITNAYPHSKSCEQAKECAERLGEGFTRRGLNVSFSLCSRNAIYNISLHDLTEIVDQVSRITFFLFFSFFWKLETRIKNDRSRLIFSSSDSFSRWMRRDIFFLKIGVFYMKSSEIIE